MVAFIGWRLAKARAGELVGRAPLDRLIALNDVETILILVIPFAAALIARVLRFSDDAASILD
jgi:uncharacterized membrane protein